MEIKTFKGGYDRNFTYILTEGKEAVVIDAQENVIELLEYLKDKKLLYIFSTHGHFDHVSGNKELKTKTGAKVVMHETTKVECDIKLAEGDTLEVGNMRFEFISSPGHCPDSMCIFVNKEHLFTGDLLFVGKVGGTGSYFPGSSAEEEWESLQKIMKLPDEAIVYPGHDYGKTPTSTIKNEKDTNPFLIQQTFEDFQHLKDNWREYKKKNNL